ncbi:hypothetical protein F4604DRAFT_1916483 [Suillus subluteus]|nr:hypothetical protein F4604DRAFT_1916483 [Suillus subluteus]
MPNTCSKEESDEESVVSQVAHYEEARGKIIKNNILAVGCITHIFALLQYGILVYALKLPYGTLALGTEGIKDAISGFEDARKSDIENERLPPELFDAEEVKAFLAQAQSESLPMTPVDIVESPVSLAGFSAHPIQHAIQGQTWTAGFAWSYDDESLDEAPEFGEYDFDDPGSARWERRLMDFLEMVRFMQVGVVVLPMVN